MKKIILTSALIATTSATLAQDLTPGDLIAYEALERQHNQALKAGGATFRTVGDTNDCDFRLGATKIQDALDFAKSNGIDEIRVATGTYQENINIGNFSVSLRGGFANCAAAEIDDQTGTPTDTVIDGSLNPNATLTIVGNPDSINVTIDDIHITGGSGGGFESGGGIYTVGGGGQASVNLTLNDVHIEGNSTISPGGGLSVIGSVNVSARNLMVLSNQAPLGGGIYCNGNEASIFIYGDANNGSGIALNQATAGSGGGAYLTNGCVLTSYVGTSTVSFSDLRGFVSNSATENGGGIYAEEGSTINLFGNLFCPFGCFGYADQPVNVQLNVANSDDDFSGSGGGVYATGTNTTLNMGNVLFSENTAYNGGAVNLADSATATINERENFSFLILFGGDLGCWSPGSCNQFTGNKASGFGGGFFLESASKAEVYRSHIQRNRANSGTAISTINENSRFEGEGLLITGNGDNGTDGFSDNNVIKAFDKSFIQIAWSTLADNNLNNTAEVLANSESTTIMASTIMHEPNPVPVYGFISPVLDTFDCMVVHEEASIDASGSSFNIVVDDPEFIDRANGDYHIDPMISPALDSCDGGIVTPRFTDSDGDERGFDWPNVTNNLGPFDIGYDEQSDIIFKDGFGNITP